MAVMRQVREALIHSPLLQRANVLDFRVVFVDPILYVPHAPSVDVLHQFSINSLKFLRFGVSFLGISMLKA